MKTIKGIFAVTLLTALLLTLFACPFTAASAEGKAVTVRFDVAFDENAYLSRYDVDLSDFLPEEIIPDVREKHHLIFEGGK